MGCAKDIPKSQKMVYQVHLVQQAWKALGCGMIQGQKMGQQAWKALGCGPIQVQKMGQQARKALGRGTIQVQKMVSHFLSKEDLDNLECKLLIRNSLLFDSPRYETYG